MGNFVGPHQPLLLLLTRDPVCTQSQALTVIHVLPQKPLHLQRVREVIHMRILGTMPPHPPAPVTLCGFWLFISLVYFTCYKNLLDSFIGWFVIWLSHSIRSRLVWHLAPNVHLTRGLAQCRSSLNMRWCPGS